MTIAEKVAYLKGLAEGLNIDTEKSKEGKLITMMMDILQDVALELEDLQTEQANLGEEIDAVSDDLSDVEELLYDDEEEDDEEPREDQDDEEESEEGPLHDDDADEDSDVNHGFDERAGDRGDDRSAEH